MKLISTWMLLCALVLAGCGGSGSKYDQIEETPDSTDTEMQAITEAPRTITLHEKVEPGQYWETSMEAGGMVMSTRWQVASVTDGRAIIEEQRVKAGTVRANLVVAYQVELTNKAGPARVLKAWVGKPGQTGREIPVAAETGPVRNQPKYETSTETFELNIANGVWRGTCTTTKGDGWESKVWIADNGWFNGMVQSESGGVVTRLTRFGIDARPLLAWN